MFKAIHKMQKGEERGFTLIELLIVIAIIAILAVIAIPQFAAYRARAIRASMQADARNVATMLEAYFADFQSYPSVNATGTPSGATFTIGTQSGKMSPNNTLTGTNGTATAYNVVVTNTAGGTGSDDFSLSSSGAHGFY